MMLPFIVFVFNQHLYYRMNSAENLLSLLYVFTLGSWVWINFKVCLIALTWLSFAVFSCLAILGICPVVWMFVLFI